MGQQKKWPQRNATIGAFVLLTNKNIDRQSTVWFWISETQNVCLKLKSLQYQASPEGQKTLLCLTGSKDKRTIPKKTHPYSVHPNFQFYLYLDEMNQYFTPVRTLSGALLNMAWSNKTWHKMFNCVFYSPSGLQCLFPSNKRTHMKNVIKILWKIDVTSFTSTLSALSAIVQNTSVLNLLRFEFICWYEYYLTLSPKQILLGFSIWAFRDWRLYKNSWYLCPVDVTTRYRGKKYSCYDLVVILHQKDSLNVSIWHASQNYAGDVTLWRNSRFEASWLFLAFNLEICGIYVQKMPKWCFWKF